MLDAFWQWASTNMALEENHRCVKDNLQRRYGLTEAAVEEAMSRLKQEYDQLTQSGNIYDISNAVRQALVGELGTSLLERVTQKVKQCSLAARCALALFRWVKASPHGYMASSFFEDPGANAQAMLRALLGGLRGAEVATFQELREELVACGVLNPMFTWSKKRGLEKAVGFGPVIPGPALEELIPAKAIPAVEPYLKALFQRSMLEQARILEETATGSFIPGVIEYSPELAEMLKVVSPRHGLLGMYGPYPTGYGAKISVAVNPLLRDQLVETLSRIKSERISGTVQKVGQALKALRDEGWPEIELTNLKNQPDRCIWRLDAVAKSRLFVYLGNWVSEADLQTLREVGAAMSDDFLFILADQSLPSTQSVIANSFKMWQKPSITVMIAALKGLTVKQLQGQEHVLVRPIVEILQGTHITPEVPTRKPVDRRETTRAPSSEIRVEPKTDSKLPKPPRLEIFLGASGTEKVAWTPALENNWHFAIVGSAGTGKTQTMKAVLRDLANEGVPYVVFDFKNDYVPTESSTFEFGSIIDLSQISVNPLEIDGSNSPKDQKYQVSDIIDLVYSIGDRQVAHIREAIRLSYLDKGISEEDKSTWQKPTPTFKDLQRNLQNLAGEGLRAEKDSIQGIFARLDPIFDYGIFSAKTVIPFEQLTKGRSIVKLGVLPNDNLKAVVCEFMLRKFRYYLYTLPESRDPRLFIVIDEAHRLKYEREASAGQLLKEARSKGVGLILATQDPVDFTHVVYNNIGGILSLCLTEPTYAKTVAEHLGGKVGWQDIKNGLSSKFSAYVKFSSHPDAIRFRVTPFYER